MEAIAQDKTGRKNGTLRTAAGFSLLEVLLTLAVFAVVLVSVSAILQAYFGVLRLFVDERREITEARSAMEKLTEALDEARRDGWELYKDGARIGAKKCSPEGGLIDACTVLAVGDEADGPMYREGLIWDGDTLKDQEGTVWARYVSNIEVEEVAGGSVDSSSNILNNAIASSEKARYLVISVTVGCSADGGLGGSGYELRTLVCTTWPWI